MNFSNKDGGKIIFELIKTIQDKKDFFKVKLTERSVMEIMESI